MWKIGKRRKDIEARVEQSNETSKRDNTECGGGHQDLMRQLLNIFCAVWNTCVLIFNKLSKSQVGLKK